MAGSTEYLDDGRAAVLIDGMDEVPLQERNDFLQGCND